MQAAAPAQVGRGTAGGYAVLAGSTVTSTGLTVLNGDLGLSPGTSITGFPPGQVNGTIHQTDAAAAQAKQDLATAYNDAAGRSRNATISADLGGQTLLPGVYGGAPSLQLTGALTLDGQGDPNAVFIFQAPDSTLVTASASSVNLIGNAQACNVFWQVGSSATLGTDSAFKGNILALESITLNHRATVVGSALARNGAVTLDENTISGMACAATTDTTTTSTTTEGSGGGTTSTTGPGGTSGTTGPGGGTTATTAPGGGTTGTTRPGGTTGTTRPGGTTGTPDGNPDGGITTDDIVRRPVGSLASTGLGQAEARLGLALTGLGLTFLLVSKRRPGR